MTPKNRTLEGKNRTLGGRGCQKSSKIVGHHLCTFPKGTRNTGHKSGLMWSYVLFDKLTQYALIFRDGVDKAYPLNVLLCLLKNVCKKKTFCKKNILQQIVRRTGHS